MKFIAKLLKSKTIRHNHGFWAEFLARTLFRLKGYKIIAQNYVSKERKAGAGEIDFIALKHNTIVFVEVKKRQNIEKALYAIMPRQQQRIINGAKVFLQKHQQYDNYDMRFDAVLVYFPLHIKHLENVFICD